MASVQLVVRRGRGFYYLSLSPAYHLAVPWLRIDDVHPSFVEGGVSPSVVYESVGDHSVTGIGVCPFLSAVSVGQVLQALEQR